MVKTKKIKRVIKKENPYSVILTANNKEYKSQGETIFDCLNSLLRPDFFKTRGIIRVKYGKLKAEKLLSVIQLKKIFFNKIARELLAKNLSLYLK